MTTSDSRIIHRKLVGKLIKSFEQVYSNRGTGPTGPVGRVAGKDDKAPVTPERSPLQDDQIDTNSELPATKTTSTLGRARPRLIRNREQSASLEKKPGSFEDRQLGPLTLNTDQISESDIEQIISDTQQSGQDFQMKDKNGKVTHNTFEMGIEKELDLSGLELDLEQL